MQSYPFTNLILNFNNINICIQYCRESKDDDEDDVIIEEADKTFLIYFNFIHLLYEFNYKYYIYYL